MARDWDEQGRYGRGYERRSGRDRDWSDRTGDEVRSWFGDDDAERRRMRDDQRGGHGYRGDYRDQYGDDYGAGGYADRGMMAGAGFGMYPGPYPYGGYIGGRGSRGDALGGRGYDDRFAQRRGGNYRDSEYRGREDRGFLDRAGDEVASWFGDEDAERRRRMDAGHRGRGPKNYTRTDERIREDVNDRLSDDPHIDASEIEVTVSEAEVTLNGTVTERFAKRHAEDIAEDVSGVKHVQNNLRVTGRSQDASGGALGAGPASGGNSNTSSFNRS
nr:SWFGD domain-containing protein [Rhizobium sp. Q54]